MSLYLALLHYPMKNKEGKIVTTCVTGFDLHDISRSAATYGVKKYFVVNPLPAQIRFAKRLKEFWSSAKSREFNWTRAKSMALVEVRATLEEVIAEIKKKEKRAPLIVATSARVKKGISYSALSELIKKKGAEPVLVLFGTGWGMSEALLKKADYILEPVLGAKEYNHLSVRGAVAIILDRLMGR